MWRSSSLVASVLLWGCLEPGAPIQTDREYVGNWAIDCEDTSLVRYLDDLKSHPGCSKEGLSYAAASIPGYQCAARAYPAQNEDPNKPIILLIHGNSDGTGGWESFENPSCDPRGSAQGAAMLSERLGAAGYRTFAIDMRHDRTPLTGNDPDDCQGPGCNIAHSMDHGWSVPLVMHFIRAVVEAYPQRSISLVGHSFGVTTIRDALRRLYVNDGFKIWEQINDVILLSGGNHGVSAACGFAECGVNETMRGRAACQIGNRDAYEPSCFSRALNGPENSWEAPCADGESAFGTVNACGGNRVQYTTIVMRDLPDGAQQDLCVSEQASLLNGADNVVLPLTAYDESDYFLCGLLKNHFGSQRSFAAIDTILQRLGN